MELEAARGRAQALGTPHLPLPSASLSQVPPLGLAGLVAHEHLLSNSWRRDGPRCWAVRVPERLSPQGLSLNGGTDGESEHAGSVLAATETEEVTSLGQATPELRPRVGTKVSGGAVGRGTGQASQTECFPTNPLLLLPRPGGLLSPSSRRSPNTLLSPLLN